jgi:ribonuclease P protein component
VSPPATGCLPRERRLTGKSQFDLVHRERLRVSDALFTVIARPNGMGHARLGMAVGRRAAGSAVNRNRVRRVVREAFRLNQQELPPLDLVVNAKPAAAQAANGELTASVIALWMRISERCARS